MYLYGVLQSYLHLRVDRLLINFIYIKISMKIHSKNSYTHTRQPNMTIERNDLFHSIPW